MSTLATLRTWSTRRWVTALVAGSGVALVVALPTAVIPNPIFGRDIAVTWWSYPIVILSGILGGMLIATYVREPGNADIDRAAKVGSFGGLLAFFAVGCPVCNKLVLLALGTSGAITWFAPFQPILAFASVLLMAWALRVRLRTMAACNVSVPTEAERAR